MSWEDIDHSFWEEYLAWEVSLDDAKLSTPQYCDHCGRSDCPKLDNPEEECSYFLPLDDFEDTDELEDLEAEYGKEVPLPPEVRKFKKHEG